MPNSFNFSVSPFDCLTPDEQALVRNSVDIAYFPEGAVLLDRGVAPTHVFVIIKGHVEQTEGEQLLASYGPEDCFDGRALVAGRASSRFVVVEELVAYQLSRDIINELIARNRAFGALLFADLGHKLGTLAQLADQHERQSLTLMRVDQAFVRPAHVVDASTDIVSVTRLLHEQRITSVLVSGLPQGLGIFSNTTLQRAILDGRALTELTVGEFASSPVISVRASEQLGDAMALLLRARVHRLAVLDEAGQVCGILDALDLFSFLANHSHLILVQIEQAGDLQALEQPAAQINELLSALHRGGTRVALMAQLVQQLNTRLFERAWQMLAPSDLVANSCLFVMGSEGRGEQLLKTDQDNGLLLRDGYVPPADLAAICDAFSAVLQRFGYPECPGRIMLNNPEWRGTASEFAQRCQGWLLMPSADSLMRLAIFLDARAVAGDAELLAGVRQKLHALATDNDALIARFAAVIDSFGESGRWWSRLLGRDDEFSRVHLKKAGIFPLVHGVRSLALARHVDATGTVERIEALVADGTLDAALGREMREALHLLMGLRLQAGLKELQRHRPVTAEVDPATLSSLERDLLKDALAVVRRFRALLQQRLRLDVL